MNKITIVNSNVEERKLKMGQIYIIDEVPFILARTDPGKYILVSLEDGNAWADSSDLSNKIFGSLENNLPVLYKGQIIIEVQ